MKTFPALERTSPEKIVEFLRTGTISAHERLHKKYPIDIGELRTVAGLGPKKIRELYTKLGVRSLADLEKALRHNKLRPLPGFGQKSEGALARAFAYLRTDEKRAILGFAFPTIERITQALKSVPGVRQVTACGSVRRMQETIGDIDIVVDTTRPKEAMQAIATMDETHDVLSRGATKTTVRLRNKLTLDVRVIPPESYGAAMQYFTGDKAHNIKLRELAAKKQLKLNEYGLFRGTKRIAGRTEQEVYRALGLSWIPPEMRTDHGEIEIAAKRNVPKLSWAMATSKVIYRCRPIGRMGSMLLRKWPAQRRMQGCPISRLPTTPKASRSRTVWTNAGLSDK